MVKPSVDFDLESSTILPGQKVAAVAAHQLLDFSELSQQEILTALTGHLVVCDIIYGWSLGM